MELLFLLILAALVRLPFILQAGNLIDFDEATFALMAKRILGGEIPFYISGHSYSGSFVSFIAAPFIALLGNTALAVKLTSLAFFLSFLAVNYALLRRIASRAVAVFASLVLILMPPSMLDVSMRVWGGHAELWVFQAGTLLLLAKYFDGPSKFFSGRLLFGLGLVIGCALWISEFFLLFLIPFLVYFFLRFRQPADDSLPRWVWNFFRLAYFRLNPWLRKILVSWHILLLAVILIHVAGIFLEGPGTEKFFKLFGAVPPFQIKMMKKLALIFSFEIIAVYFLHSQPFSKLLMIRNLGPMIGGLLLGYFPAILFNLAGGEGLRIFQKSGALSLAQIPARAQMIFTQKIPQFILGLGDPFYVHPDTLLRAGCWIFGALVLIALLVTGIYFRKRLSYVWIFFMIAALTLAANLLSTLEAARYLAPLYIALAAILGYFLGEVLWKKWKFVSVILTLVILSYFGYGAWKFYEGIPKDRLASYTLAINYLGSEKTQGGLACRTLSHILTYLSGEKIVFSTYLQPERYLPHEKYTQKLHRKTYVFEADDSTHAAFQKDPELFAKVKSKEIFGNHVVYILDDGRGDEDLPYSTRAHKFPIRLYLNE